MKTLRINRVKAWFLFLILTFTVSGFASAQSDSHFDQNRMNRDLSIMQDVLGKLFNNNYNNRFSSLTQPVNGTYLPGYGVIFRVPGSSVFSVRLIEKSDNLAKNTPPPPPPKPQQSQPSKRLDSLKKSLQHRAFFIRSNGYRNGLPGEQNKLTKKEVIDDAVQFLENYAEAIGQIKPDEHIVVIYQSHGYSFFVKPVISLNGNASGSGENQSAPLNISVSALKSNITAYRMGKISDKTFRERLKITDLNTSGNSIKDIKIMSGILQSALQESEKGTFTIRGDVKYLIQPGYGAIFFARADYNNDNNFLYITNNGNTAHSYAYSFSSTDSNNSQNSKLNSKEHIQKAYDGFVQNIKQSLIDYGRTMQSLKPGQEITFSVDLNRSYNSLLPKRIDFRVSQKTLSDYNMRKITMNQAMKRIVETRY